MLKKLPKYTLDIKEITKKETEVAGHEAVRLATIYSASKINQRGFVLVTHAFDDFIISQNLVTPITAALKRVKPFEHQTAVEASHTIAALINGADIPEFILEHIDKAYHSLSKVKGTTLAIVQPSYIFEPQYSLNIATDLDNVYSLESLVKKIKFHWMQMFSIEALEQRANNYYKGPLTMAVIIQKMVRPEISGKVYSIPPITKQDNTLEIHAQYGMYAPQYESEIIPDIYTYNIKTKQFVEKNIVSQDLMYIRKGRTEKNRDTIVSVEISKEWRNQQKLSDTLLVEICKKALEIEKSLKVPVEIAWAIESGEIYITGVEKMNIKEVVKSDEDLHKKIQEEKIPIELVKQVDDVDLKKLQKEIENAVKTGKGIKEEEEIRESKVPLIRPRLDTTQSSGNYTSNEKITTKTHIYSNVSKITSTQLAAVKHSYGGFFDITEEIMEFGTLPEMHLHKPTKIESFQNAVMLDIQTCLQAHLERRLMVQFSTLTNVEYDLLKVDSSIYNATGDERFIEFPEVLAMELQAIVQAHEATYGDEISVVLPGIRSIDSLYKLQNIIKVLKIRADHLTFLAEISIPSMLFQLEYVDRAFCKGIVINYPILAQLALYKTNIREVDHAVIRNVLEKVMHTAKQKHLDIYLHLDSFDEVLIKDLVQLHPKGIIFNTAVTTELLQHIAEWESL